MLNRSQDREQLEQIFRAGLAEVEGGAAVEGYLHKGRFPLPKDSSNRLFILGAGKAAAAMAKAAEAFFLREFPKQYGDGLVVVKEGHVAPLRKVRILEAGHPLPDERGLKAARDVKKFLHVLQKGDVLFFLLSGGASALLPAPAEGVTFDDKRKLTQVMLASGADIHEINALRKHCSFLKGGRLLPLAKGATVVTLAISDVPGDQPEAIGSGPTVPDPTTRAQCLAILERYRIKDKIPSAILNHLQHEKAETPKPGDPVFSGSHFEIVANNRQAVHAAAEKARGFSYEVDAPAEILTGDISQVAGKWVELKKNHDKRPSVIIRGGEPTVRVAGSGQGGRNLELALRLALALPGKFSFLSAGSDGTDGPTDAAGAFCDESTVARAQALSLNPEDSLNRQDSYPFFEKLGDLLKTGPTATNVMDLQILCLAKADN